MTGFGTDSSLSRAKIANYCDNLGLGNEPFLMQGGDEVGFVINPFFLPFFSFLRRRQRRDAKKLLFFLSAMFEFLLCLQKNGRWHAIE